MLTQLAVAFCGVEAVRALADLGCLRRDYGNGPEDLTADYLELAVRAGQGENALFLMERGGLDPMDGLKDAVTWGRPDMARLFLERGALEGYVPQEHDGFVWEVFDNLLADAARTGGVELAALLLEYGCPVNRP